MLLQGKVAIITGGGSGMGKAMARLFSSEGAKVIVADLNGEAAKRTAAELSGDAIAVEVNVTSDEQVKALVAQTISHFGQIDSLVNNAGVPMSFTPVEE
ncbi:SDR family NAD(P)-dependent oxidoreductase, partial [Frankia sp. Cpl3]|nr:SDR family NAD(P)-dependent oxidoreductase [Frankia sp. Cpl3]